MKWLRRLRRKLAVLLNRDRFENELDEEMRAHIEMQAAENRARGMDDGQAWRAARRQFGNPTLMREDSREQWAWVAAEAFVRDLRHAGRSLRRSPAFTAMAILTLAVGVGANTAMFSVVRAVLLRPLPYQDPGRLEMVWLTRDRPPTEKERALPRRSTPPFELLRRWQEHAPAWESLAGYSSQHFNLSGGGTAAERVNGLVVTPDLLPMLGVTPALGRSFSQDEEQPGHGGVVILSDGLWRDRYGADPGIVGQSISLDGTPYEVVGVLPGGFEALLPTVPTRVDVCVPLTLDTAAARPVRMLGRLQGETAPAAAEAPMQAIADAYREENPLPLSSYPVVRLTPLVDDLTIKARPALLALTAAVGCVLLIVCVNLAALLLARAAARQHELDIRAALGAGRWRLARQHLSEGLLLGLGGGSLGLALTWWTLGLVRGLGLGPGPAPRLEQAALDPVVFVFCLVLSLSAGILFGAAPALAMSRTKLDTALRQRGNGTGGRYRLRSALIAGEVALALVLATCAGLLLRSYTLLQSIDPGFASDHVLTMQFSFPEQRYDGAGRADFLNRALERVASLPSVEAAGAGSWLPLAVDMLLGTDAEVRGRPPVQVRALGVTGGYGQVLGLTLVAGDFLREGAESDVVVNEVFCKRFGIEASRFVGEQIVVNGKPRMVAGVVRDVRDLELKLPPEPTAFLPYAELSTSFVGLAVRAAADPTNLVPAIRAEMHAIDPELPVARVQTMTEILAGEVAGPRFYLSLVGTFSAIAVGLAALGVYGLLAYLVSQRRREIGVRMALGAGAGSVVRHVMARGLKPVAAGAVLGIAGARVERFAVRSRTGGSVRDCVRGARVGSRGAGGVLGASPPGCTHHTHGGAPARVNCGRLAPGRRVGTESSDHTSVNAARTSARATGATFPRVA